MLGVPSALSSCAERRGRARGRGSIMVSKANEARLVSLGFVVQRTVDGLRVVSPSRRPRDIALSKSGRAGRWRLHAGHYPTALHYHLRGYPDRLLAELGAAFYSDLGYAGSLRDLADCARMPVRVVADMLSRLALADVIIMRVDGSRTFSVTSFQSKRPLQLHPGFVWGRLLLRRAVRRAVAENAATALPTGLPDGGSD